MLVSVTWWMHLRGDPRQRPAAPRTGAAAALAALLLLATSCATDRSVPGEFVVAPLYGMVYDQDSTPVAGASVTVDRGAAPIVTDINGRFVVAELSHGSHSFLVEKAGHEAREVEVLFNDRRQILYVRMSSAEQLLDEAEGALAQRRWVVARELLDRAQAIDARQPVGAYLRATLLRHTGDPAGAARMLDRLVRDGHDHPYVYLALADVYQYDLDDGERAAAALDGYLQRMVDPEARARREQLRAASAPADGAADDS